MKWRTIRIHVRFTVACGVFMYVARPEISSSIKYHSSSPILYNLSLWSLNSVSSAITLDQLLPSLMGFTFAAPHAAMSRAPLVDSMWTDGPRISRFRGVGMAHFGSRIMCFYFAGHPSLLDMGFNSS
jgi:hypothetical protein